MSKKQIIYLVLSFLFFSWFISFIFFNYWDNNDDSPSFTSSIVDELIAPKEATFLILGVDEREDDGGRSDVMIFMNFSSDKIELISIPRDTYMDVPTVGFTKINHAYAYGKEHLACKSVEKLLDRVINYTVVINIQQAEKIIDKLGGIDVNIATQIDYDDPYDDNGGLEIHFSPGQYHLNGKDAVRYLRFRDEEGDIGRIKRQQQVFYTLLTKFINPANWKTLYDLIQEDGLIKTNVPKMTLLGVTKQMILLSKEQIHFSMLEGYPAYIDQISYWIPNKYKNIGELKKWKMEVKGSNNPARKDTIDIDTTTSNPYITDSINNKSNSSTRSSDTSTLSVEESSSTSIKSDEQRKKEQTRERVDGYLRQAQHYLPPGDPDKINNSKIKIQ